MTLRNQPVLGKTIPLPTTRAVVPEDLDVSSIRKRYVPTFRHKRDDEVRGIIAEIVMLRVAGRSYKDIAKHMELGVEGHRLVGSLFREPVVIGLVTATKVGALETFKASLGEHAMSCLTALKEIATDPTQKAGARISAAERVLKTISDFNTSKTALEQQVHSGSGGVAVTLNIGSEASEAGVKVQEVDEEKTLDLIETSLGKFGAAE